MATDEIETVIPEVSRLDPSFEGEIDRGREQLLITEERTHKLDLLLHLVSNLDEPIVLIGPDGIGKSKVFNSLEIAKLPGWTLCRTAAALQVSFEDIEGALNAALEGKFAARSDDPSRELANRLKHLAEQKRYLVLLLDDAGKLEPGLLSRIYQLAIANPGLRVVFSITPNELHVKHSTDPAVGDCHFVEIPPLSEEECGLFLKNLSRSSEVAVTYSAVTPEFVHNIYRESHGIPGKILSILPEVGKTVKTPKATALAAYIGMALVVATAVGTSMWGGADKALEESRGHLRKPIEVGKAPEAVKPATEGVAGDSALDGAAGAGIARTEGTTGDSEFGSAKSEQEHHIEQIAQGEMVELERHVLAAESGEQIPGAGDAPLESSDPERDTPQEKTPLPPGQRTAGSGLPVTRLVDDAAPLESRNREPVDLAPEHAVGTPAIRGADWLLSQSPGDFTLQVMAVSSVNALEKVVRQYPKLENMAYFRTIKSGRPLYPVVVGIYPSMDAALAAKRQLPRALGSAWVRRLKLIQSEIRAHTQ